MRSLSAMPALSGVLLAVLCVLVQPKPADAQEKLLITQVMVLGGNEYVVIKNPGGSAVDLSNYYLTDATFANGNQFYYNLPDAGLPIGGGTFNDFVAKFPAGAMIAAGDSISVSINGSDAFEAGFGIAPDFELFEDGASPDGVPDMEDARAGSIITDPGTPPTLSNSGEVVIFFHWDGATDLVTDIDYLVWGDNAEAVDKTGITIDGPDPGTNGSTYNADVSVASQELLSFGAPTDAFLRADETEGTQVATGSNGVGGRSETSENLMSTFVQGPGNPPGEAPVDVSPPTLASAGGTQGTSTIAVTFSEPVATGADVTGNYEVFPTATPGSPLTVTNAAVNTAVVTLTVAETLGELTGYTVRVNNVQDVAGNTIAMDSETAFSTGSSGGGDFSVTSVFQFGSDLIGIAFSDSVDAATVGNVGNYSLNPSSTITAAVLQSNQQVVILQINGPLAPSTSYNLTVMNVQSRSGTSLDSTGPFAFTTIAQSVVNIRQVQENWASYEGQTFTVVGQVFVPQGYRGDNPPSAYIQDGSGRGINVFGGDPIAVLDDVTNVVAVTGSGEAFFTTREITGFTAAGVASGLPALGPERLTVSQAASPSWEGTFIETMGEITSIAVGAGPGDNYTVTDGSSTVIARVVDPLGVNPNDFSVGETITVAGAGGQFQDDFQINVGRAEDIRSGGGGPDVDPPVLLAAAGEGGTSQVTVTFNESVVTGANVPGNYTVYPTATPGSPITVSSASPSGPTVTLNLAQTLANATGYTVEVSNVQDAAGNSIAPGSNVTFISSAPGQFEVTAVYQFGSDWVGVAYSDPVNQAQAANPANYAFNPDPGISTIRIQENGQTALIQTGGALSVSTTYNLTVSGVTNAQGASLVSGGPFPFTTAPVQVTNIREIQENFASYDGTTVAVIGQVFVPFGFRVSGTTGNPLPSGYIQDGSGRGINVFGGNATDPDLSSEQTVVLLAGSAEAFETTREVTDFTKTVVATGVEPLGPRVLTTGQANSSDWEGTFIEVTGEIQSIAVGSGPGDNYIVDDGSGEVILRVWSGLSINPNDFGPGDEVTGRGAGGEFTPDFQVNIATDDDMFLAGMSSDPPRLVAAQGGSGTRRLELTFDKTLDRASAEAPANYEVFPSASPDSTFNILLARLREGRIVDIDVDREFALGTQYTVTVDNVTDTSVPPLPVAPGTFITFVSELPDATTGRITIPARTVIKTLETLPIRIEGERGSKVVLRVFDMQGRMVRVLYDGFFSDGDPIDIEWDARDDTLELVRAGTYICHLETTDNNGRITKDQAPIVVSVRLE